MALTGAAGSTDEAAELDGTELLRRQETLLAFFESVSSELELRPLLDRILMHACHLLRADDGAIGLVDRIQSAVRIEAACCMDPDEIGLECGPGEGLAGRVLELDDVVVLERYSDLPVPIMDRDNAVLGVPIRWRGEMIGYFGIGRVERPDGSRPEPFSDADVEALGVFARHAAIAIVNAKRYLRAQEHGERLELIAKIGTLITAGSNPEGTLQAAAELIHDLLGYPNIGIGVIRDETAPAIEIEAMAGEFATQVPRPLILPARQGLMGVCARERQPVRVDDVHADPRYIPAPGVKGIRCLLAMPILFGDDLLGVLNVESDEPFDEEDSQGLQIVADQLAVAMHNERLNEQAQQGAALAERQRIARELHDSVTQHLFGTVMLAESLPSVWERDAAQGRERAARVLQLSRTALSEMRALLAEMRPGERGITHGDPLGVQRVRAYGLADALGRLAAEVSQLGLDVECSVESYTESDFALEEALYRITQEALTNAVKHAKASKATVRLSSGPNGVRLVVADDGQGMAIGSPRAEHAGRRLGLNSMRERAAAVGGELALMSAPGDGVRVEVTVPEVTGG